MSLINLNAISSSIEKVDNKSQKPSLEPNKIHNVKFRDVELKKFKGQDGSDKETMEIVFYNDNREYKYNIWKFQAEDFKEKTSPFLTPAYVNNITKIVKDLILAVDPDKLDKFLKTEFPDDVNGFWIMFIEKLIEILKPYENKKEFEIKLFGRVTGKGEIVSELPKYIYKYNQKQEVYNIFGTLIGTGLAFNNSEKKVIAKFDQKVASLNPDGTRNVEISPLVDNISTGMDDAPINAPAGMDDIMGGLDMEL